MAGLHEKHTVCTGEYVGLIFWCSRKKNQVTHHLLLTPHQCSNYLFLAAMCIVLEALYLHSKANDIAKVQAHLAYHGPGCSIGEACQKCDLNLINFTKMQVSWSRSSWKKKRRQKSLPMLVIFCPCSAQSQMSFCIFFNIMSKAWP